MNLLDRSFDYLQTALAASRIEGVGPELMQTLPQSGQAR
jgi:hypothetical protein